MKIVVAGGRSKANFLIGSLLEKKHKVTVTNDEEAYCRYPSGKYNIPVVVGNPYKWYVLEEAGIDHAGISVALRLGDPDNLAICQTAKKTFHVERAVVTVSSPRNVSVFKKLGVNTATSAVYTTTKITEQASTIENLANSLSIEQENIVSGGLPLTGKCAIVNKKLKELSLPKSVTICCILRNVDMIVPNGETALQEHNKLLLLRPTTLQEYMLDMLIAQGLAS